MSVKGNLCDIGVSVGLLLSDDAFDNHKRCTFPVHPDTMTFDLVSINELNRTTFTNKRGPNLESTCAQAKLNTHE